MGKKQSKFESVFADSFAMHKESSKAFVLQSVIEGDKPEYQYIRIDNIQFNPNNDYSFSDSYDDIRELSEDIKRNGMLHNIVVSYREDGTYILLSGERRLRAYRILLDETNDPKFSSIYSLVRKGLSEVEEMIILDAANLQVRNGMSDEKRYRKATVRFINNLRTQFNISDDEAIALTKQYTPVTAAVIEKNIVLERDLHHSLLSMLDNGYISKSHAYEYARLPRGVQELIATNLESIKERSIAEIKSASDELIEPAKEIRALSETLEKQREGLMEIKEDIKEVKKEKRDAAPGDIEELDEIQRELEAQKKQYSAAIRETEQEIEDCIEELNPSINNEDSNIEENIAEGYTEENASERDAAEEKRQHILGDARKRLGDIEKKIDRLSAAKLYKKRKYLTEEDIEEIKTEVRDLICSLEEIERTLR